MYADRMTDSMQFAISETMRRPGQKQLAYNEQEGIDPQTVRKKVTDILEMIRQRATTKPKTTAGARPGTVLRQAAARTDRPDLHVGRARWVDPEPHRRDARSHGRRPALRRGRAPAATRCTKLERELREGGLSPALAPGRGRRRAAAAAAASQASHEERVDRPAPVADRDRPEQ